MKTPLKTVSVFLLLLLVHTTAWAQATAQLTGTVRDESGAVLPGVTVTVTQTDTGFTRTVVTEGSGAYIIPNLPLGPYRLEVALSGFRTYVQTGIVLQVGATPTVNAVLAVGNVEETVAVEAAAPLVDVQSAGISEVVENERIVELPLQGRQVTDLIVLGGAAVNTGQVSGQRSRSDSVAISVAGGLRTGVAYVLDGAMHNDAYDNLNMPFPFPDALQEFRVATSGLSADNGVHSGASVNAVTKSGTNRFSGNAFEFLRDSRFNATDPFAAVGTDGKRVSDGLNRNQFGGTIGGPIVRDKLFFFGAYQGTKIHQVPASFISWVPTDAMLAGDFTAYASPACNAGRQIALRAPFVDNRINPALLSKAAVAISNKIPSKATNPCGEILFSVPLDNNDKQYVTRLDYQMGANHSIFGRYIDTFERRLPTLSRTGNPLAVRREFGANKDARAQSTALGDTLVLGANMVNSLRFTWNDNRNSLNDPPDKFFDAPELGINLHTYVPGTLALAVTDGFTISGGNSVMVRVANTAYQVADDVTLVRGRHQIAVGGNLAYWKSDSSDFAHTNGTFSFNGQATGRGLTDFLTGQASSLEHGAPNTLHMTQWYLGVFAQDAWRATDRLTLNLGVRWEPYFGQNITNGAVSNFVLENFRQGIKTQRFMNAPAGIIYPGDPGFPDGLKGTDTQWGNLSPRAGVAWDVRGDGRTAVRSSYAMAYDFPTASFMYKPATGSPFSNRLLLNAVSFEDPYRNVPGGQTHPLPEQPGRDAIFPSFAQFLVIDPGINSTRAQNWNLTVEQQIGTVWQASVSYLGSYLDRLWGGVHQNPGVFLGLGPCTLNGVSYPTCTTDANLNQRRVLYRENPVLGPGAGLRESHLRRRHAELPRAAVVRPAWCRQRPERERELHAVQLRGGHGSQRRLAAVRGRVSQSGRSLLRPRELRQQPHPHHQRLARRPDTELHESGAAHRGVRLARVRDLQRAIGRVAHRHDRPRHRRDRDRRPAAQPGERRGVRRQVAHELFQPGGLRLPGGRNARQSCQEQHRRSGVLDGGSRPDAARSGRQPADPGAPAGGVQPPQSHELGQPDVELRFAQLRPHHGDQRQYAHHSVWSEVWVLGS